MEAKLTVVAATFARMGSPPRPRCLLVAFLLLTGALGFCAYVATAASPATLTATAVQIGGHPAYVQATVEFSGPSLSANHVRATSPNPYRGTAGLLVSAPYVGTRVPARTADGITVQIVEVPGGLSVGIGSLPGAFKYLSYAIAGDHKLLIYLWDSTLSGRAADVPRGHGGCLSLGAVRVSVGVVSAAGIAQGLFESHFRVIVRDSSGRVLASRPLSAAGRWSLALRYSAPQAQWGSLEAAASAPKDGSLACLVQKGLALPASNARANLKVVHRAHTDVNGDGRPDLVTLHHTGATTGRLEVDLAAGSHLTATTPTDARWLPGLVATGNVDGRPGDELFIDVTHITTSEDIWIYTTWHGRLRHAGSLPAFGYDYGIVYGITCSVRGATHFVTDHAFSLEYRTRRWRRQDTVYLWKGPSLTLYSRGASRRIAGEPPASLVGVQCGHVPSR